jgi:hypothetical protein
MINILISLAAFACVKGVFLWIFASERERTNQATQVSGEGPYLLERPDGLIQASSSLSGNRLLISGSLTWIDQSEPS